MKLALILITGCFTLTALAQSPGPASAPSAETSAAPTNAEVAARESALALAGAFANDGFKVRDGHWSRPLVKGAKQAIEVNLYAGNEYWFSVGATSEAKALAVKIFDESGAQVNTESYAEGMNAAAGLKPESSGPYFVQVEETEGADATFCLVYSYK